MVRPRLIGPPQPELKASELAKAVGKEISRVEFGEQDTHAQAHAAEAIILHFTDGSSLSILVGSNALNIATRYPGIKPKDFRTDLMVFWNQ